MSSSSRCSIDLAPQQVCQARSRLDSDDVGATRGEGHGCLSGARADLGDACPGADLGEVTRIVEEGVWIAWTAQSQSWGSPPVAQPCRNSGQGSDSGARALSEVLVEAAADSGSERHEPSSHC